ncbi:MAG: DUF1343 domain-containing protein [Armatimonadetes bacterium]|nr:DUF1343 domain-containing protein [Armatimonadota bacterium]
MKKTDDERTVGLGVEQFLEREDLKQLRFGILTNALATTSELVLSIDALLFCGFQISALFVPEHGFYGAAFAGEKIPSGYDEKRQIPIFSLYGDTSKPQKEWLEGLDALLVDLPDVGCRFYTYPWTMSFLIEAASEMNLPVFVLDRPNPINGIQVEGKCQTEISGLLVGRFPTPIRHGMTLGELALWLHRNFFPNAKVEVVACRGWKRKMWWDETGLPWVSPSPAMATLDTATVYCGTCLVEGTNLSEGRGTYHPFEFIGAPFADEDEIAKLLNSLNLSGVKFRPVRFVPATSKHAGEICKGVQVHVIDRDKFSPVRTGLCIIAAFKQLHPKEFSWKEATFDRLVGTNFIRKAMDETDEPIAFALSLDLTPDDEFMTQRANCLIYD